MSQTRVYEAKYEYSASSDVELSIEVGDILIEKSEKHGEWIEVTKYSDNSIGFVPFNYIEELPKNEASKYLATPDVKKVQVGRSRGKNTFNRGDTSPTSNLIATRSSPPRQPNPVSRFAPVSTVTTTPPFLRQNNDNPLSFVDTYDRSERMFRQIMKQREEMFQKLEDKLNDAAKEVAHFQEKNEEMIDRIKQLDADIESERNRIIDSLNTSKPNIATATAYTTSPSTTSTSFTSRRRVGQFDKKRLLSN